MADEKDPGLTDEQKTMFDNLQIGATNVALMQGTFRGLRVGVLVGTFAESGGQNTLVVPIAILCDESFMEEYGNYLLDPNGNVAEDLADDVSRN